MLRMYLAAFILIPPLIRTYPYFWAPLLSLVIMLFAWMALRRKNYRVPARHVRGTFAAQFLLLVIFSVVSSVEDLRYLIYFFVCVLAYYIGLMGGGYSRNLVNKWNEWIKFIVFMILIYLSFISTSLNLLSDSSIRSNYIGIAVLTCGLLWSEDYKFGKKKWIFIFLMLGLVFITLTRSIILASIFSVLISLMKSWKSAAITTLSVIVVVFFVNINLDAVLSLYLPVAQDLSIIYSGKPLDTGRSGLWLAAVGDMNFRDIIFGYSDGELDVLQISASGVHNGYLYLFLSSGVGALISFVAIIIFLIRNMWKNGSHIAIFFMLAILIKECFEVTLFAGNLAFAVPFWLHCGLAARFYILKKRHEKVSR